MVIPYIKKLFLTVISHLRVIKITTKTHISKYHF
ncbi:hypothetical protein YPF_4402 [Yersinia pestis biovar Orientalis str. India 195]|nr:hypothetical protein YPF_4402 [Yersinia pestis biovar Orientalis str. India 195]